MGLGIYTTATPSAELSTDTFTNPFSIILDGRVGGSFEQRLYLRNDDATLSFSGVHIAPVDSHSTSIVDGTNGYGWKLNAGDTRPTVDQWNAITPGSSVTMSGLGTISVSDTSTYLPFWVQVSIPRNAPVSTYQQVQLQITATKILI